MLSWVISVGIGSLYTIRNTHDRQSHVKITLTNQSPHVGTILRGLTSVPTSMEGVPTFMKEEPPHISHAAVLS